MMDILISAPTYIPASPSLPLSLCSKEFSAVLQNLFFKINNLPQKKLIKDENFILEKPILVFYLDYSLLSAF